MVQAHALASIFGGVGSGVGVDGVADDLDVQIVVRDKAARELIDRLSEAERDGFDHGDANTVHRFHPIERDRSKLWQRRRPLVRPAEAEPCRTVVAWLGRFLFGAVVELIAPVGLALGALVAKNRVATKRRRVLNRECATIGLGQCEELVATIEQCLVEFGVDAMADQVHESGCMQMFPELSDERLPTRAGRVSEEVGDVNDRKRRHPQRLRLGPNGSGVRSHSRGVTGLPGACREGSAVPGPQR